MNLDLSYNRLEGVVPKSLAKCSNLQVANLGNNMLNGTFPSWLGTLENLQVLVLRSNRFHGAMTSLDSSNQSFSKLRVLDVSGNQLNGTLSSKFIENLRAMRIATEGGEQSELYLEVGTYGSPMVSFTDYVFTITMTVKGPEFRAARILNTLTTIDVSSNMFQGDIPTSIGDLAALGWLNMSHNNFANEIPSTIGDLKVLESLDLSCNSLSGQIPRETEKMTALEVFNLSQNQLVGPIPQSTQLDTFTNASYLGNPGLCGPPFSKKCKEEAAPQPPPPTSVAAVDGGWASDIQLWKVILMGCGFGWVVGVISGYFML